MGFTTKRGFKILKAVARALDDAKLDVDTLPATHPIRKYLEFVRDPSLRVLPEGTMPDRGSNVQYGLRPFTLEYEDANKLLVALSGRAHDNLGSIGGTGLYNLTANPTGHMELGGFFPAKAISVQKSGSSTGTVETSRITGRKYRKKTAKNGFTVPFGASAATDRLNTVAQQIIADSSMATRILTFEPEFFDPNG